MNNVFSGFRLYDGIFSFRISAENLKKEGLYIFEDKLINVIKQHAGEISNQWCKAVRSNPRTPSYHSIEAEQCVQHSMDFYKNLGRIYFSEKPYTEIAEYFTKYAEERYKEGIPLHEAVYALIMMRRHMWIYADFQAVILTGLDQQKSVESINKTIRIFDHGIYIIIKRYEEMRKQ